MNARLAALLPVRRSARAALVVCALLAVAERVAEAAGAAPAWASARLDDLVCLPLVLGAVLAAHRLAGRPASWRLPPGHGLLVAAAYAVFFEIVLPRWNPHAVADLGDVAAYAAGLAVFQLLINRPGSRPPCAAVAAGVLCPGEDEPDHAPTTRERNTVPWTPSKPSAAAVPSRCSIPPTA